MAGRAYDAERIAALAGPDVLTLTAPRDGWPAHGSLRLGDQQLAVSLYAAPVGLSHRNRDAVERRFQNPGSGRPIVVEPGRRPLLVGVWEADQLLPVPRPLLVVADAHRRAGLLTRYSVFATVAGLLEASTTGWSTVVSGTGEPVHCLLPPLLPVAVGVGQAEAVPEAGLLQAAVAGSGLVLAADGEEEPAGARARRAALSLVRDARFSKRVLAAYAGLCAMCGLDVDLVQGAHIYPAAAPGSQDEPWNGVALCPNHHLAFDRHLVAVRPEDRSIALHNRLLEQRHTSPAVRGLVDGTYEELALPAEPAVRPRRDMFERRYAHYPDHYGWLASA